MKGKQKLKLLGVALAVSMLFSMMPSGVIANALGNIEEFTIQEQVANETPEATATPSDELSPSPVETVAPTSTPEQTATSKPEQTEQDAPMMMVQHNKITFAVKNMNGNPGGDHGYIKVEYGGTVRTIDAGGSVSFTYDSSAGNVKVTFIADTGYSFEYYVIQNGSTHISDNPDYINPWYYLSGDYTIKLNPKWDSCTTYSVTYNGNGNTTGTAPTDSTNYIWNQQVTVKNQGSLSRDGYTFTGWNTQANGGGTAYAASANFNIKGNVTLYAQWSQNHYSVTYNGNGNTGGTAPTDSTSYTWNQQVTVKGNTGSLTKTGSMFSGWNTQADGNGTAYAVNTTFNIKGNVTLYAQWSQNHYSVTYNGNGNTAGTAPTDSTSYTWNQQVTVKTPGSLARDGYTFTGWNTQSNGGGTAYAASANFNIQGNVTLYAQWSQNHYSVTYNGNGNTAGTAPTDSTSYTWNQPVTVQNQGSLARAGYTFTGWNTQANGGGTAYAASANFNIKGNVTLYAQWSQNHYSVTYNGNGNTGGTAPTDSNSYTWNQQVTVKGNTGSLTKTGSTFGGWNTEANGSGTAYAANAKFNIQGNVTLYAQWSVNQYTVTFITEGPGSLSGQTFFTGIAYNTPWGTAVTLPTPTPNSNAYFVGWTPSSFPTNVTQNLTFKAKFACKTEIKLTAGSKTLIYDGQQHTVTSYSGVPNGLIITGVSAFGQGTNAGTYPVTFTHNNVHVYQGANDVTYKYTITYQDGSLKINKKCATIDANNATKTYGDADPAFTATVSGTVNGEHLVYSLNRDPGESVNLFGYTIHVSYDPNQAVNANYDIHVSSGKLFICRRDATITVDDKTKVYGQADPTFTSSVTGTVNGEQLVYSLARIPGNNVGQYLISPIFNPLGPVNINYDIHIHFGTLTITKAPLTVKADDKNTSYGSAAPAFTAQITGFVNGDDAGDLHGTLQYACSYAVGSPAGTYDITPSGLTSWNYQITFEKGTLTVDKVQLSVTADDKSITYGDPVPTYTAQIAGFVNGDDASDLDGTLAFNCTYALGSGAGTYTITPSGLTSGNYEIQFVSGQLTVSKAQLLVTADDKNVTYGDPIPTYTVQYTGFLNGDDASDLGGALASGCAYAVGSGVGTYTITPSGLTSDNYSISYANGTLTVAKAVLTVTANDQNVTYGGAVPTYTAQFAGFVNGEAVSALGGTLAFDCTYAVGSGVGTYTITPSGLTSDNYSISYANGTLTVAKAVLTVTANDRSVVYGSAIPAYTAQFAGFVNGEAASALGGTLTFDCAYAHTTSVGTLPIAVSGLTSDNYNIQYVNGTLTVTRRAVTIRVDDKTKVAGETDPAFTATVTGLVNGDTLDYTLSRDTGETAGSYAINATYTADGNYSVTVVKGTMTITATSPTPTTIPGPQVPESGSGASWALLNLLLAIGTALLSVGLMTRKQASQKMKMFSIVPAVVAIVAFLVTENMSNPMIFIDMWTLLMVAIAAVQGAVLYFSNKNKDEEKTNA